MVQCRPGKPGPTLLLQLPEAEVGVLPAYFRGFLQCSRQVAQQTRFLQLFNRVQLLSKGGVRGNKLQVRLFVGSVDGPSPQNAAAQKGLATAPSLHQTTWNALLQTKGITQDAHLVERLERGWRPFYLPLIYKPLLKARFPVNNQTLFDPKALHE